jgi:hypothetical protein
MSPWCFVAKGASSFLAPPTLNCRFMSSSLIGPGERDIYILTYRPTTDGSMASPRALLTAALNIPW